MHRVRGSFVIVALVKNMEALAKKNKKILDGRAD